ncbi:MAG: glycosyltransferase, partial [Anaerolineae bacterium]
MRITLLTYGSRGDVEPFVALGEGLTRAGYKVRLAAPAVFSSLANSRDISFVGLPGRPEKLVQGLVDAGGRGWPRMVRAASRYVIPLAAEVFEATRAACEDAEGIVHSFLLTLAGHEIALEREIPDVSAQLFPVFSTTTAFPAVVFPDLPLGATYRGITHGIVNQTFWQTSRLLYGWVRRSNPQLPRLTGWPLRRDNDRSPPILYAFSPRVVSRPEDWPEERHVTGYWFLEEARDWEPPEDLVSFLKAGSPPVCIGLGSTVT